MPRKKRTNWANVLTWARLGSIIPVTIAIGLEWQLGVLILYIFALLTDVFDGYIARKLKLQSKDGAALDSIIDYTFALATLWWAHLLFPTFYAEYWVYLAIVILFWAVYEILATIKYGHPLGLHLWTGKASMFTFGILLPIMLVFGVIPWYIHVVWIVAVISKIEAIIFVLKGKKNVDAKTAFS